MGQVPKVNISYNIRVNNNHFEGRPQASTSSSKDAEHNNFHSTAMGLELSTIAMMAAFDPSYTDMSSRLTFL